MLIWLYRPIYLLSVHFSCLDRLTPYTTRRLFALGLFSVPALPVLSILGGIVGRAESRRRPMV
jgi:hypothetical protein